MTRARHLEDSLNALRSEVHGLDLGDGEARQRVDSLLLDVGTRVGAPDGAVADDDLTARLRASVLSFEGSHPKIAVLMNDVLEKLSTMGI